jgi:hypothetical protein
MAIPFHLLEPVSQFTQTLLDHRLKSLKGERYLLKSSWLQLMNHIAPHQLATYLVMDYEAT